MRFCAVCRGIAVAAICGPAMLWAESQAVKLNLVVESAPPGGWVQIKVFAASPAYVQNGSLSLDLDPATFGDVSEVALFSAAGDAIGYANVSGRHVDVHFTSATGDIGQLPDLPILAISVPVNSGAAAGRQTQITVDPSGSTWEDAQGDALNVMSASTQFTVGSKLSVESVSPGAGWFPPGTVLHVEGTGFDGNTTITADGVSLSSVTLISATQIDITLGGAAEITGKHFHVANSTESVNYYAAAPSQPGTPPAPFLSITGVDPLVPLSAVAATATVNFLIESEYGIGLALLNQNAMAVSVTFTGEDVESGNAALELEGLTIPPGELYFIDITNLVRGLGLGGYLWINSSAPIRMMEYTTANPLESKPVGVSTLAPALTGPPPAPIQLPPTPSTVSWNWAKGSPLPSAANVSIAGRIGFQVSISGGAGWLQVTPSSGTAPATLTLTANPSSLAPGIYSATVAINPVIPPGLNNVTVQPASISVSLTVSAAPLISVASPSGSSVPTTFGGSPGAMTSYGPDWMITGNGNPASFQVTFQSVTGGNWLIISPTSGLTPATLNITVDASHLAAGTYSGVVTITGPGNTVTLPVSLVVNITPPTPPLMASPAAVSLVTESGASSAPAAQTVSTNAAITVATSTASGGAWLNASVQGSMITVNANASTLSPGTYQGTITASASGLASIQIPVTLTVFPAPTSQTQVTVTPSLINWTVPAYQTSMQSFDVTSSTPVLLGIDPATLAGAYSIYSFPTSVESAYCFPGFLGFLCTTPVTVDESLPPFPPGTYTGNITIHWDSFSRQVPVTIAATAVPGVPPVQAAVLNAASWTAGSLAPGEIITITGTALGGLPAPLEIGANGKLVAKLDNTQLLINGMAAPLLYVGTGQINAIVPYEVATTGNATVQLISQGQPSAAWEVPLAPAAPAIFTIPSGGVGQGAILNQDNSINGPSQPAARGTVIQIFATGDGLTTPSGVTGSITGSAGNKPVLPGTVSIGGVDAIVEYAGSAPEAVAGLLQVNAMVPQSAPAGPAVPIVLRIGNVQSPADVTVAVR